MSLCSLNLCLEEGSDLTNAAVMIDAVEQCYKLTYLSAKVARYSQIIKFLASPRYPKPVLSLTSLHCLLLLLLILFHLPLCIPIVFVNRSIAVRHWLHLVLEWLRSECDVRIQVRVTRKSEAVMK